MTKTKKPMTAADIWEMSKSYNRVAKDEVTSPTVVVSTTNPKDTSETPAPETDTQEPQNPENDKPVEKNLLLSLEKRVNDNLRYIEQLKQEHRDEVATLKTQLNTNTPLEFPKTEAQVEAFAKQHPDIYNIFKSDFERRLKKTQEEINQKLDKLEARDAFAEVLKAHPDANEIKDDIRFKEWLNAQIPGIRNLVKSSETKDAIFLLDKYKKDTDGEKAKKHSAEESAKSPAGSKKAPAVEGEKPIFKDSDVAKMSQKQYELLEKEIDLARKEGRYIYDMSALRR